MKRYWGGLFLLFLWSFSPAFASDKLSEGYSEWSFEEPCDAECQADTRDVTHIILKIWLFKKGHQICGFAQESYAPRGRVPSGRIAGQQSNTDKYIINFTDSFNPGGQPALAELQIKKKYIYVKVLKEEPGFLGFASAEGLKRVKKNSYFSRSDVARHLPSCLKSMGLNSVNDFLKEE